MQSIAQPKKSQPVQPTIWKEQRSRIMQENNKASETARIHWTVITGNITVIQYSLCYSTERWCWEFRCLHTAHFHSVVKGRFLVILRQIATAKYVASLINKSICIYEKLIGTSIFLCSPISLKFELHAQITKQCDAFLDHGQQAVCRQSERYSKAAHCILGAELLPEASRSLD